MIKLRLIRFGARKKPSYRIVAIDSQRARQSRTLDTLGYYNPRTEPLEFKIDLDKVDYWLKKGAQPSETVNSLINRAVKGRKSTQDSKS
ncbi:MAG: SSU ribosomal protein S16p [Candidatus Saccharicenans subterraneus]|uniref:Small ribosomal subunit protein bS16 n=1 Tax=Candidatus Saccharicenans subterraneus TaxID=2508984 RepID=A0A3E2BJ92_9BACT|nr:MAG: SSU ribosomal protein S16p [Candidatus Saccharicenans subterraneum]